MVRVPETAGKSLEEVDLIFRMQARGGKMTAHEPLLLGGDACLERDCCGSTDRRGDGASRWWCLGWGWWLGKPQPGHEGEHIPLVA